MPKIEKRVVYFPKKGVCHMQEKRKVLGSGRKSKHKNNSAATSQREFGGLNIVMRSAAGEKLDGRLFARRVEL